MGDNHVASRRPKAPPWDAAGDYHRQRLTDGTACLDAAFAYLKLGWAPLALCPPDHVGVANVNKKHSRECDHPGKVPWFAWKGFQDRPPTEAEVRGWWRQLPNSNVGIALGPVSGLVRVDVEGEAGEVRLAELSNGNLPPTLEFASGREDGTGRGLLYRIPEGVPLRTSYESHGKKQELRFQAKGAQTVLPPSRHKDGNLYAWTPGHGPEEIEAAPMPAWLLHELAATRGQSRQARALADGGPIPQGARNTTLTSMAVTMRLRGFSREAIEAALLIENEARCDPPLEGEQVRKIARSVARYEPEAVRGCGRGRARARPQGISVSTRF
jgi:putative DNA primase/helicase